MTRAHRQRHRWVWLTLFVLLPLMLAVGLLVRRPVPVMRGGPDLLAPRGSSFSPP
jgi:hypothetical protein